MLAIPKHSHNSIFTIGIDPGTMKLGLSIMEIELDSRTILNTSAYTLRGDKLANSFLLDQHYGNRYSRVNGMMDEIAGVINSVRPFSIITESPFYNPSRPAAFQALIEVIDALRSVVCYYDLFKPLHLVDPSSVKNAVGAKGGAHKFTIRDAVLGLKDINYRNTTELHSLDEHAIDSIAVNYWYFNKYLR